MLDEATSALDSHTEKEIQDALDRVARSRTTLVIAHRLSTVDPCRQHHRARHGRIVEQGTHAELLADGGLYAEPVGSASAKPTQARERLAEIAGDEAVLE